MLPDAYAGHCCCKEVAGPAQKGKQHLESGAPLLQIGHAQTSPLCTLALQAQRGTPEAQVRKSIA